MDSRAMATRTGASSAKAASSTRADTPAPNRWPRGSIIRALGRRAAASAGTALGIGGLLGWDDRWARYHRSPTELVGYRLGTASLGPVGDDVRSRVGSRGDDLALRLVRARSGRVDAIAVMDDRRARRQHRG